MIPYTQTPEQWAINHRIDRLGKELEEVNLSLKYLSQRKAEIRQQLEAEGVLA